MLKKSGPNPLLIYISNARIPSEKANANQSMQQCAAFADFFEVEFWYAKRRNPLLVENVFEYFGVPPNFTLKAIPNLDLPLLRKVNPKLGFLVQAMTFSFTTVLKLLIRRKIGLVFTRNDIGLWFLPLLAVCRPSLPVIFEDQAFFLRRLGWVKRYLLYCTSGVVVTSSLQEASFIKEGVSAHKLVVARNAVDFNRFEIDQKESCNPNTLHHVFYVGNLFRRKGVYTLVDATEFLSREYVVHFVGGSKEAMIPFEQYVEKKEQRGAQIRLHGHVQPSKVAELMKEAHILVLPNSGDNVFSEKFTSPMKLFEYMAAGRPIVATNVPAVREVLEHGRNAYLVKPDDPQALAEGIRSVSEGQSLASLLGANAKRDVENFTWAARTETIRLFISKLNLVSEGLGPSD